MDWEELIPRHNVCGKESMWIHSVLALDDDPVALE